MKTYPKQFILYIILVYCICSINGYTLAPRSASEKELSYSSVKYVTDKNYYSASTLDIAYLIDKLDINASDTILLIGPGTDSDYPVCCSIKGAKTYIAQPSIYQGSYVNFPQTKPLKDLVNAEKRSSKSKYGVDLIGDNVDFDTYEGYIQDLNVPKNIFSHIFLLSVLDDMVGRQSFYEICKTAFLSLQDNGKIIISSKTESPLETFLKVTDYGNQLGYLFSKGEYHGKQSLGSTIDPVTWFSVRKNNERINEVAINSTLIYA